MARKVCPQCKRITGASAQTCSGCGHTFEALALVEERRARRCLECGLVHPATARRCQCGFEFDIDPVDLRAVLARQRSAGRGMIATSAVVGVVGLVVCGAFVLVSGIISIVGIIAVTSLCTSRFRKGARILDAVRTVSDELEGKTDALPSARIHQ